MNQTYSMIVKLTSSFICNIIVDNKIRVINYGNIREKNEVKMMKKLKNRKRESTLEINLAAIGYRKNL